MLVVVVSEFKHHATETKICPRSKQVNDNAHFIESQIAGALVMSNCVVTWMFQVDA